MTIAEDLLEELVETRHERDGLDRSAVVWREQAHGLAAVLRSVAGVDPDLRPAALRRAREAVAAFEEFCSPPP